jgi:hypothetical protein
MSNTLTAPLSDLFCAAELFELVSRHFHRMYHHDDTLLGVLLPTIQQEFPDARLVKSNAIERRSFCYLVDYDGNFRSGFAFPNGSNVRLARLATDPISGETRVQKTTIPHGHLVLTFPSHPCPVNRFDDVAPLHFEAEFVPTIDEEQIRLIHEHMWSRYEVENDIDDIIYALLPLTRDKILKVLEFTRSL